MDAEKVVSELKKIKIDFDVYKQQSYTPECRVREGHEQPSEDEVMFCLYGTHGGDLPEGSIGHHSEGDVILKLPRNVDSVLKIAKIINKYNCDMIRYNDKGKITTIHPRLLNYHRFFTEEICHIVWQIMEKKKQVIK